MIVDIQPMLPSERALLPEHQLSLFRQKIGKNKRQGTFGRCVEHVCDSPTFGLAGVPNHSKASKLAET